MVALKISAPQNASLRRRKQETIFHCPTTRQRRESGEMTIICRRRRKESLIFDLSLVTSTPTNLVAVRKNLDLVWVWFYKEVAPTALNVKTITALCYAHSIFNSSFDWISLRMQDCAAQR
jgi:hypothetical protein